MGRCPSLGKPSAWVSPEGVLFASPRPCSRTAGLWVQTPLAYPSGDNLSAPRSTCPTLHRHGDSTLKPVTTAIGLPSFSARNGTRDPNSWDPGCPPAEPAQLAD